VKAILCIPLLLASYAYAEEAADRTGIEHTIAALNELPRRTAIFTGDAASDLRQLPDVKPTAVRGVILGQSGNPSTAPRMDGPTVTISGEPFGEATINFPSVTVVPGLSSTATMQVLNPRIASGAIRFISPDVAVADGTWTYKDNSGATQTTPLLFVMKKEGDDWKIATLRALVPAAHGSDTVVAAP
jgi:hypothetical protein